MKEYYTSIKIKFPNIILIKTENRKGTQNAIPFVQSSKIGETKLCCLGKVNRGNMIKVRKLVL